MANQVLFQNGQPDRPATFEEYLQSGGYRALADTIQSLQPREVVQVVLDSGLRGRGGAAFPTGRKWKGVPEQGRFPRYLVANCDEMEPGTFKDRVLVNTDPHMVIEGIILAGYAISAQKGIFFVRPSYEMDAALIERELGVARSAGYLGQRILGSEFSFDITVHRSAGRYISGEATAQVNAIMGNRAHPNKTAHMAQKGLWDQPTIINNVETLACVPHILRHGSPWFKGLAKCESGAGTKLYSVSGKVKNPGCFELPLGTRLSEIIDGSAGGMIPGSEFKACLSGGASTRFMPKQLYDIEMDFDVLKNAGHRLGTGAIIVFDRQACLVGATLNLIQYFARESCGFCTPCREGLPYMRDLLWRIENGDGEEAFIPVLRQMTGYMKHAYCALAIGAAAPLDGLLTYFEDEVYEHISQRRCPFSATGVSYHEAQA